VTRDDHDDAAGRQLRLLVGFVVMCALGCVAWSIRFDPPPAHLFGPLLILAALVTAAASWQIKVRVRSTTVGLSTTSSVILVCVAFIPPGAVTIAAALGMVISTMLLRLQPIKVAFNIGRETVAATAAATAAALLGVHPQLVYGAEPLRDRALALLVAAIVYAIVDDVLATPVLALVSGTTIRQRAFANLEVLTYGRLGGLAVAVLTTWAYSVQPWLVASFPVAAYALHLWSANRIQSRVENEAWQRLAQATDELNVVKVDSVLHTAVLRAADLFSADEVDVETCDADGAIRLVRGDGLAIRYDGPMTDAPTAVGYTIPIALESYNGNGSETGTLRLRFRGQVRLSERERYTLRTFAAALCTAIRNAMAFAETHRLADAHARAAAQDPLTQLANRRGLQEYGDQVLAEQPSRGATALLLIDLNHFKEVNDTLGHSAGDQVLVEVAHRLAGAVQPGDLVARLGGDEFAVLFVGLTAPAVAVSRAHIVLAALSVPIELDGMRLSVEASGGVANAPDEGSVVELLRRADVAMYQAKRDGRRVVVYAATRDTADMDSLALGGDLHRAVAESEFIVDFQPIVDLGTGEAIAAEALARWHHPDRGALPPARFLDAIERSGQLPAFAEAVLDQALVAAAQWREAGFPLTVAVNVSPRSLLDPSFPDIVAARLASRDVPPEMLVIELTETVTLSQLLTALRELGVALALDDFGTGYSSLATLARVPVHELKIDRSFVSSMDSAPALAVVRSTIDLGRTLDLLVVAEGIEREEQHRQLWELGCPAGQGHLFARPMPAARFLAALQRGTGGRPGILATPLHEGGVIRIPASRRGRPNGSRAAESR
jgi:diguanylate cyclase (GGDEF)-like protein